MRGDFDVPDQTILLDAVPASSSFSLCVDVHLNRFYLSLVIAAAKDLSTTATGMTVTRSTVADSCS